MVQYGLGCKRYRLRSQSHGSWNCVTNWWICLIQLRSLELSGTTDWLWVCKLCGQHSWVNMIQCDMMKWKHTWTRSKNGQICIMCRKKTYFINLFLPICPQLYLRTELGTNFRVQIWTTWLPTGHELKVYERYSYQYILKYCIA